MTVWARLSADLDDLRASGHWPSGPTTVLEIIGQTRLEASHEKLIAWLLHPLANHGLGSAVLASLLMHLDDDRMPSPEQLTLAHVRTQVVGASGRPDIVVMMPGARLVIELKIDAKEGITQTSRQADDYTGVPNVSFVFLTLGGSPPSDPRFKHLLLRDFFECLHLVLDSSPPPVRLAHVRGRAVAEDYAATLERMLGLDPIDQEAARYWLRYASEIKKAEAAAQRLLKYLHEYTERAFAAVASSLGDDVQVVTCTDRVTAGWKTPYDERAVLLTRESWMRDTETPRLGIGLGISTEPKADWTGSGAYRPFWGVYAKDEQVGGILRDHLSRIPERSDAGGEQWGPWARWWYIDLEPPDDHADLLSYYATSVTNQVSQFWQRHRDVLDQAIRSTGSDS
jgi:hypothetical protein